MELARIILFTAKMDAMSHFYGTFPGSQTIRDGRSLRPVAPPSPSTPVRLLPAKKDPKSPSTPRT